MTKTPTCWLWSGANVRGYGQISVEGKTRLAHRVSWWLEHGVWPEGLMLHHCDTPACVRLSHLYEGTQSENMQNWADRQGGGGYRRSWTHCQRGHELSGYNLKVRASGHRVCRECLNRRKRESRRRAAV